MLTETFALESYPERGARATRTISSRLRDGFRPSECGRKRLLVICGVIFLLAFGVRFLSWQDNRREVGKVQTLVTADYQDSARQLRRGDWRAFISDLNHMEHPPGYPILLAGIFTTFGESDTAIEFIQMIADSAAAVFVFLIAGELFSLGIAGTAGILAALSPQFAYHSVLLLPDSLAVLPILIAAYFLVRAIKHPRFLSFVIAGAFVGLSCWLRANALLLAPFLACLVPLLLARGRRLRYSAALIFGAAILIAPITIKNALVFRRFIPLSLGAGQTFLEGIADYDTQGRFNIPRTDLGIMKQEAEDFHRPDYYGTLFNPDGVERERWRIRRGLKVIASHPVWYSGVMFRRGISFFRVDRVPITNAEAPVSHALEVANTAPAWTNSPSELIARAGLISAVAKTALSTDAQKLRIESDETKYGVQIVSTPIAIEKHHDYLLRLPLKLEDGRVIVRITDVTQSKVLASTDVDLNEVLASSDQPVNNLALPFVSGNESQVCVSFGNNAPVSARSVAEIGGLELFDLGPSSQGWMRYTRFPIRTLQRFFVTAAVLPCVILGIFALLWTRNLRKLILLLLVPAYYVIFQSALHTERRYVIAIHYFMLILAAAFLSALFGLCKQIVVSFLPGKQTSK
jgi:Dolichyl-phosphate-mannose-protein mannosyltransferase